MAQQKQSARQISDAAAAALMAPKVDALVADPIGTARKAKHTKPDNFVGDRPGYFRGARVRR